MGLFKIYGYEFYYSRDCSCGTMKDKQRQILHTDTVPKMVLWLHKFTIVIGPKWGGGTVERVK